MNTSIKKKDPFFWRPEDLQKNHVDFMQDARFAVLDLGASKATCLIAQNTNTNPFEEKTCKILGFAQNQASCFAGGYITNFFEAVDTIKRVVAKAEEMAHVFTQGVFVHTSFLETSSRYKTLTHVFKKSKVVSKEDCLSLIEKAKEIATTQKGMLPVHIIPVMYTLDETMHTFDPIGMQAAKVELTLHVISVPEILIEQLRSCLERAHLFLSGLVVAPFAASLSLQNQMRSLATILDMGAATTALGFFVQDNFVFTHTHPQGGQHLTQKIAEHFLLNIDEAEAVKVLYGHVNPDFVEEESCGEHSFTKKELAILLKKETENMLKAVATKAKTSHYHSMVDGPVLLFGGASQLRGIEESVRATFFKEVFCVHHTLFDEPSMILEPTFYEQSVGTLFYARTILEENAARERTENAFAPHAFQKWWRAFCGNF